MIKFRNELTPDTAYSLLNEYVMQQPDRYRETNCHVLYHPDFHIGAASVKKHQNYTGGLCVHTAEVWLFARDLVSSLEGVDMNILFSGVLWHDFGKLWDNTIADEQTDTWTITEHKLLVYHISRSYAEFMIAAQGKLSEAEMNQIGHKILSHHGRREWGSPVIPLTLPANVLHFADSMSARLADTWNIDVLTRPYK